MASRITPGVTGTAMKSVAAADGVGVRAAAVLAASQLAAGLVAGAALSFVRTDLVGLSLSVGGEEHVEED